VLKYILALLMTFSSVVYGAEYKPNLPVEHIAAGSPAVEKKVRDAAVKVSVPFSGGHGSGSYIKYKDLNLVVTAQHVVDSSLGTKYLVSHKGESHIAILIYSDSINDIALLYVQNAFDSIEPMKYNPVEEVADIGTEIYYSGYPASHKLMSFRGMVAGYEHGPGIGKRIILSTYGWFGCSGSIIYDVHGRQIGVLYGVDVEYYPNVQVQENMIWVVPMNKMNINRAIKPLCRGYQGKLPKACK